MKTEMYKIYYSVAITLKKENDFYGAIVVYHMSGYQEHKNNFSLDVEKTKNESLKNEKVINDIKNKYKVEDITVLEIVKIKE